MKKIIILLIISAGFIVPQIQQQHLSVIKKRGTEAAPAGYVTDSLKLYYVLADLSNGSISDWYDDIANYRLTIFEEDTTRRPIKSATRLDFDGDDWLRGTASGGGALPTFANNIMSVEVVATIADTTTGQLLFGVRNTCFLAISLHNNFLCAYAYNGTTEYWANAYSTRTLGTHHYMATWDGSTDLDLFFDGVLLTPLVLDPYNGLAPGDNRAYMGGESASSTVNDGTSIPLARAYHLKLSPTQVDTNFDSDSVQDLIP